MLTIINTQYLIEKRAYLENHLKEVPNCPPLIKHRYWGAIELINTILKDLGA